MSTMTLVHHARRTLANHRAGNPFADRGELRRTLTRLEAAYLDTRTNAPVSRALIVELDRIGDALTGEDTI